MFGISPDQAWQAEILLALRSAPPSAVIVDVAGLAGGLHECLLRARLLLTRIGTEIPGVPVILTGDPMSPHLTDLLLHGADLDCVRDTSVVPVAARLRSVRVRNEWERAERLRQLCSERRRVVIVVAPSRGIAARLRTALHSKGIDCGLFHSGLTAAERTAVLAAIDGARLRVLVATEAILVEPAMARAGVLVFSHPPALPEIVTRAGSWAGTGEAAFEIVMLFARDDFRAMQSRARARTPTLADVRETYRSLRAQAREEYVLYAMTASASVPRHPSGPDQSAQSLALLEIAGYCRRLDDFPRAATITALVGPDELSSIPPELRSSLGHISPLQPMQLAGALRTSPVTLQRSLLEADRNGTVAFRPHGRETLYELLAPPPSATDMLSYLVSSMASSAARAASTIPSIVLPGCRCRVQALAMAMSWSAVPVCGHCDRCLPEGIAARPQQVSDAVTALTALAGVPFAMRRGAVHRVIAASLRDANRAADREIVGALIDELLARRLIERRPGQLGDLFGVGEQGRAALDAWDQV